MLSDIEIAQSAELKPIAEIANQLGISADELEFYGKYKAKLSDELAIQLLQEREKRQHRWVLVRLWLKSVKRQS